MTPTIVFDFDGTLALGAGPIVAYARAIARRSGDTVFLDLAVSALAAFEAGDTDLYRDGYDVVGRDPVQVDARTNRHSGGVGATISAIVSEQCFDLLDAPVRRLCMDDAPVPYASSMEKAVVKRGSDLVQAVYDLTTKRF